MQFLRELRQLRDGAGLEQSELAARAHYPYDRIKAAEVGPTLPDLPVLSAYVRGCGGTTEEWEERWRSLTSAPTLPLLGTRPAGCSTAASAGARIGSISPVADTPDPSIILAALDRVAEEMAVSTPAPLPSHAGVSTIEQRPAISPATATATATAAAATAKSASSKAGTGTAAGTGKVAAWETTTMRTAWSSAAAPTAREVGQPTAVGGPTGAAGPTTAAGAGTSTAAGAEAPAGSTGYTAATSGKAAVATGGSSETGGSAAVKPVASAPGASTRATAVSGPSTIGRRSRGLSRTTVAALIAIAVCVLVALLATFA